MVANEMMSNINMFGTRGDGSVIGKSAGTLIIGKKGERARNWKRKERKKEADPRSLLDSMRHGIILRFGGRKRNGFLLHSRPGDKTVHKIETVTRDALPISLVRSPISIGYNTIADKTTNRCRNSTP